MINYILYLVLNSASQIQSFKAKTMLLTSFALLSQRGPRQPVFQNHVLWRVYGTDGAASIFTRFRRSGKAAALFPALFHMRRLGMGLQ